ncbi:YciE/YciF ferroxidase family protein [Dyadobacter sp.]|uniref:YciE/YciF ferroxidase family protein n=1 Tax=Dyadobacter sp. TaxID=1914288 RepID=UPI003F6E663A
MEITIKKSRFYELFLSELREMLWVEQKMWGMLRMMQGVAQSQDFSRTLAQSRVHASAHIDRIRHLFDVLGEPASGIESAAIGKLLQSVEATVNKNSEGAGMGDFTLIIAAQKAGQYKVASYENLITIAQVLGDKELEKVLEANIIEDAGTDLFLRELSERFIYQEAASRQAYRLSA